MNRGFTLSEVLITLGIIGVVAAMTLPQIVHNYKKQEVEAKLKKFYTTMSQAVKLSEVDNGPAYYWTKDARMSDEEGVIIANPTGALAFYERYLAKYLKLIAEPKDGELLIALSDGSTMSMRIGYCLDMHFDYNGKKGVNTLGVDKFDFLLCTEEGYNAGLSRNRQNPFDAYFPPYCARTGCSRTQLLNECKSNPLYCSGLLMYDGWEIKDDYPYKLK